MSRRRFLKTAALAGAGAMLGRGRAFAQQAAPRSATKRPIRIVMGGYSHIRLLERFLGGVTYSLLHESPIPLLMAH